MDFFRLPDLGQKETLEKRENDYVVSLSRRFYRMSDIFLGKAIIGICREARQEIPSLKPLPSSHQGCGLMAWHIGPELGYRLIMRANVSSLTTIDKKFMLESMKDMGSVKEGSLNMIKMFGDPLYPEEHNQVFGTLALDGENSIRAWIDEILYLFLKDNKANNLVEKVFLNDPCNGNIFVIAASKLGYPPIIHRNGKTFSRGWSADRIMSVSKKRSKMGGCFNPGPIWSPAFQDFNKSSESIDSELEILPKS